MFSKLLLAFPAFVVAAAGVAVAELYLIGGQNGLLAATGLVAFLFFLGHIADATATQFLLPNRPVAAVWAMELWSFCPGLAAICAAASLVVLNVRIAELFPTGPAEPETIKALVTALTALVTAGFLKAADEADESWIAPHIKKAFEDKYRDVANRTAQSPAGIYWFTLGQGNVEPCVYQAFYAGTEDWGFKARHKRARGIAAVLPNEPSQ